MKLKTILATGSAIALLTATGMAYADSNKVVVRQNNTGNSALINQVTNSNTAKATQDGVNNAVTITQKGGDKNQAGGWLEDNSDDLDAGAPHDNYNFISQHGDKNDISILQNGDKNQVAGSGGGLSKLLQEGDRNSADITQTGNANMVDKVHQKSTAGANGPTNILTIVQGRVPDNYYGVPGQDSVYGHAIGGGNYYYNWNTITNVEQTNTGGSANTLTLNQKGAIYYRENRIIHVVQNGTGNTGTIDQNGILNYSGQFSQIGANNEAHVALNGFGNGGDSSYTAPRTLGAGAFSANSPANGMLAGAAGAVGVGQSDVMQNGANNDLSFSVNGNSTRYGFEQLGDYNDVSGATSGDNNEVAVMQNGSHNVSDFTQTGDNNDLGVVIYGDRNGDAVNFRGASDIGLNNGQVIQKDGGNYASISIGDGTADSDNNNYAARQTGGGNTLTLSMLGGDKNNVAVKQNGNDVASIDITGGQNVIGAQQLGTGTNTLEVTLFGNNNNWSGGFSGDAGSIGLSTPGSIYQNGNGNEITLNVGVSAGDMSSSNLFAFKQTGGDDNTITGSVMGGDNNQVAVLQNGSSNTASFIQVGSSNNIGISQ